MRKKRIGIVVACELDVLKEVVGMYDVKSNSVFWRGCFCGEDYDLVVVKSGVGEIYAAAATQYLISEYRVDVVVNYGVVGSIYTNLHPGDTVLVGSVVQHDFDISAVDGVPCGWHPEIESQVAWIDENGTFKDAKALFPDLKVVRCASGDQFIADQKKKLQIRNDFGADVCDMEAAGIALVCKQNHVPCVILKTVADGEDGGSEEYWENKEKSSQICVGILNKLLREL